MFQECFDRARMLHVPAPTRKALQETMTLQRLVELPVRRTRVFDEGEIGGTSLRCCVIGCEGRRKGRWEEYSRYIVDSRNRVPTMRLIDRYFSVGRRGLGGDLTAPHCKARSSWSCASSSTQRSRHALTAASFVVGVASVCSRALSKMHLKLPAAFPGQPHVLIPVQVQDCDLQASPAREGRISL
jgi:hypothetical protein